MKTKKIKKLAEKKLKKANKWLEKNKNYDFGYLDGTYESVKDTKEICEMILEIEKMKH